VVEKEPEIEIVVGSRWRGQRRWTGQLQWQRSGWPDGYEVMAIISDGTTARSRVQVRAYNTQAAVVWTLQIEYWFEDGFANPMSGCDERMIPWV
jgi:hypothetical protein